MGAAGAHSRTDDLAAEAFIHGFPLLFDLQEVGRLAQHIDVVGGPVGLRVPTRTGAITCCSPTPADNQCVLSGRRAAGGSGRPLHRSGPDVDLEPRFAL